MGFHRVCGGESGAVLHGHIEEGRAAAAATVDAAVQASDRINVLNGSANAGKRKPIGFGIGLHMGSVT